LSRALIDHGASLRRRNASNLSPLDVAGRGLLLAPAGADGHSAVADGCGLRGSSSSSGSGSGSGSSGSSGSGRGVCGGVMGHPPLAWGPRLAARRALYRADPRSRTLVLSHEDCLGHLPRSAADWECPERIADVMGGIGDPTR
jgi:hypothetical protein